MITVRIIDQDGQRTNRDVEEGTRLHDVVDVNGYTVILESKVESGNPELRDGDVIELMRKSGKAGK